MISHNVQTRANARRATTCPLMVNNAGLDLCAHNWYLCSDTKEDCSCTGLTYLLAAACQTCANTNIRWASIPHLLRYTNRIKVGNNTPEILIALVFRNTGTNAIPSWAVAMISATPTRGPTSLLNTLQPTTFDLAAASGFLLSTPTSVNRPGTSSNPLDPSSTMKTNLNSPRLSLSATSSPSSITGSNTPPNPPPISPSSQTTGSPSQTIVSSSAISSTSIMGSESIRGNTLPIRAIIGVVIAICSILASAALLVWFRRRRPRQKNSHTNIVPTPYPFLVANIAAAAGNSHAQTITKIRQQFLRNELRAAQEQIIQIQNLQRGASSKRGRAGSLPHLLSSRRAASTGSSRTVAILRLQERNEMLTARIRELEAGLQSPWALGLSDEPPPGYVE
ncbi:hypothetical protein C8R45DRAFT_940753 [Mycena sanguinolenta]|nr:hypothetical protein C8R45DRAFT_940753 [Mycena sanguinolenta]